MLIHVNIIIIIIIIVNVVVVFVVGGGGVIHIDRCGVYIPKGNRKIENMREIEHNKRENKKENKI